MKTYSSMLKAPALALGVLCLGLAGAGAAGSSKLQSERGTISSVDQEHHSLVVADHSGKVEHKFQWNNQTKFTVSGKVATAAALKAGEHVVLSYESGKELPTMKTVELTLAKEAKQHTSLPGRTSKQ